MKDNRHIEMIKGYVKEYKEILKEGRLGFSDHVFPLDDGSILAIPGENSDERYPYGEGGYNFWIYSSGYMHANDGLFSTFLRPTPGEDPKCAFFAEVDREVISLLHVPVFSLSEGIQRFTVFSKKEALFITMSSGLIFGVIVRISADKDMTFNINVMNECDEDRDVKLSAFFNPYLRNSIYESSEDKWFRQSYTIANPESYLKSFVFLINEDLSRTESVTNFGVINRKYKLGDGSVYYGEKLTTSPSKYKGGNNHSLINIKENLSNFTEQEVCAFTETAVAADLTVFKVGARSFVNITEELRYSVGEKDDKAYDKLMHMAKERAHEDIPMNCHMVFEGGKNATAGSLSPKIMSAFTGHLMKQVEFCSMIKGYVQLSPNSLIGIRDVFQALEGYIYINPKGASEKMLEGLGFIDPSGRCPRQYGIPAHEGAMPAMDLREFIDQGCWVIDCIMSYLKLTGDYEFLDKECGYYEIIDETARITRKSEMSESVLKHMIKIMDFLIDKQDKDTGCIRALYGDWNDALDGLGVSNNTTEKFGNGVSVMASLQVYKNLNDMVKLIKNIKGYGEKADTYARTAETLKEGLIKNAILKDEKGNLRIAHGWGQDKRYYVGSFKDPDNLSRHGLTSNAFWVLSGMERNKPMKETILSSYESLDSKYGFKTFEPAFGRNVKGVGRIYKLPPGTAENGASYIHATTFAIMSLFMMGESKKAWDEIIKILPFTHDKLSCSPYVMPNSYGLNTGLNIDGESMQDWQTGSSNVIFKTLVRFVFGFMPDFDTLTICPGEYMPFKSMTGEFVYCNKKVKIRVNKGSEGRRIFLNGKPVKPLYDDDMKLLKAVFTEDELTDVNEIEVIG
ncbi:MAG: hypothetical protein J6U37_03910 [Lachnospiraceae bacterium]|nr:hypothetical protein [Lachnospiraceae bacterium]